MRFDSSSSQEDTLPPAHLITMLKEEALKKLTEENPGYSPRYILWLYKTKLREERFKPAFFKVDPAFMEIKKENRINQPLSKYLIKMQKRHEEEMEKALMREKKKEAIRVKKAEQLKTILGFRNQGLTMRQIEIGRASCRDRVQIS